MEDVQWRPLPRRCPQRVPVPAAGRSNSAPGSFYAELALELRGSAPGFGRSVLWVIEFLGEFFGEFLGDIMGDIIGDIIGDVAGDLADRARGPVGSDAVVSLPTGKPQMPGPCMSSRSAHVARRPAQRGQRLASGTHPTWSICWPRCGGRVRAAPGGAGAGGRGHESY